MDVEILYNTPVDPLALHENVAMYLIQWGIGRVVA
jgi:hypothetical protein